MYGVSDGEMVIADPRDASASKNYPKCSQQLVAKAPSLKDIPMEVVILFHCNFNKGSSLSWLCTTSPG